MKAETKPVMTFTEKEYKTFNDACMILDDLVNGEYRLAFESIMGNAVNLDALFDSFVTITDYMEEHKE